MLLPMRLLKIIMLISIIINPGNGFAQDTPSHYFGFSLYPGPNSSMVSFGIITIFPDNSYKITALSQRDFYLQAMGMTYSKANPDTTDLFELYEIENIYVVDSLWKLRYAEYPFENQRKTEKGWANKDIIPSPGQFDILNQFGIRRLNDFCYGENAWKLLHVLQDPFWIRQYKMR